MSIVVVVAHPDDEVIGAGGIIAKYAEKEEVYSVIVSKGDSSTVLVKPNILAKKRKEESEKAAKILKNKVIFLGISETNFREKLNKKQDDLKKLLIELKPKKIFTHCLEDSHPHHREIARVIKSLNLDSEIYTFTISNPFRILDRNQPRLYVDTSGTAILKRRALHCFKSQWYLNGLGWYLYPLSCFRDKINGLKIKSRYAEVFYKL
ncbi:MAG: PIG-L family deacetylase [Candidatus Woesearchaeota archaeon]|nr:MAG: PIG-L family deacetylase [Candidatus Woesearchaeota archaeon]